jgi:hypothetical protein
MRAHAWTSAAEHGFDPVATRNQSFAEIFLVAATTARIVATQGAAIDPRM